MTSAEFGARVRRLRKSRGFDQLSFALATGYANASAIAKIEKGVLDVHLSTIFTFASVLNYPVAYFFFDDPDSIKLARTVVQDLYNRSQLLTQDLHQLLLL
jgi:transcriptional regulator with XRE-family HTH domain